MVSSPQNAKSPKHRKQTTKQKNQPSAPPENVKHNAAPSPAPPAVEGETNNTQTDGGTTPPSPPKTTDEVDLESLVHPWAIPALPSAPRGLTGLLNLGNTCYLNSVLQALANIAPLSHYFGEGWPAAAPPLVKVSHRERHAFVEHFAQLVQSLRSGKFKDFKATLLTRDVIAAVPEFQLGGQQDAQEALNYILNHLHDELQCKIPASHHPARDFLLSFERDQEFLRKQRRNNKLNRAANPAPSPTVSGKKKAARSLSRTTRAATASLPLRKNSRQNADDKKQAAENKKQAAEDKRAKPRSSAKDDRSDHEPANTSDGQAQEPKKEEKEQLRQNHTDYVQSIINDTFQTFLVQTVTCAACGTASISLEEYLELSAALPSKGQVRELRKQSVDSMASLGSDVEANSPGEASSPVVTPKGPATLWGSFKSILGLNAHSLGLDDCLKAFFAPEKLEGDEQYFCESCNKKEDATKSYSLAHLPEVLCIHLKRFNKTSGWGLGNLKNGTMVNFPLHDLDLSAYMYHHRASDDQASEPDKGGSSRTKYDLISVVKHTGGINSGHYIACCKNFIDQKWYEYDDEFVYKLPEDQVVSADAYLLFYAKRPTPNDTTLHNSIAKVVPRGDQAPNDRNKCVYLPYYWTLKWRTFSNPGPLFNRDLCCEHGNLMWPVADDPCKRIVSVPVKTFQLIKDAYGGGPELPHLKRCEICFMKYVKLQERRQSEYDEISRFDQELSGKVYMVSTRWLRQWRSYVLNEDKYNGRGTWIGVQPPGPMSNDVLLDSKTKKPKRNLRHLADYRGVNESMWTFFMNSYGGGPVICRATEDIYGQVLEGK